MGNLKASSTSEHVLFGRKKIYALLEKRLEAFQKGYRQNIALVGPPAIGKTHLLRTFLERVSGGELIVIPFTCREFDSFERFSQRWIGELLLSFHVAIQRPMPSHVHELIRSLKNVVPKTLNRIKAVKKMILKNRLDHAFHELLALTGNLQQECGKKILFIIEEFDRLGELKVNDPFSIFGREMMIQKDTMFIVTSSRPKVGLTICREKLSLLFGNFELIEMSPFEFDESREFIAQFFSGTSLEHEVQDFLIRLTDGHPQYLDMLLRGMQACSASGSFGSNLDLVIETLTRELFYDRGTLNQCFQAHLAQVASAKLSPYGADVLTSVALGHKKLSQISRFLGHKTGDVKKVLERLAVMDKIVKHGFLYQIPDVFFRFWLAHVYYRRRFLIDRSSEATEASFQSGLRRIFEEGKNADRLEVPKRLEHLLWRFNHDVVEINHKKLRCPHFVEVLLRPDNGQVFPVYAKNGRTRWICHVMSRPILEEDVHTIIQDSKRYRGPAPKKFVLGLQGIDLNAKLLAHEAKIQYLDLRAFNFLLDLYDQPKIIV